MGNTSNNILHWDTLLFLAHQELSKEGEHYHFYFFKTGKQGLKARLQMIVEREPSSFDSKNYSH